MPNHPDILHPESGSRVLKSSQLVSLFFVSLQTICKFFLFFFFVSPSVGCCRSILSLLAGKRRGGASELEPQLALNAFFERNLLVNHVKLIEMFPFVYIFTQDPHGSITPSPLDNMRGLEYYLHDMMHNNAAGDGQDQQAKGGDEPH